MNCSQTDMYRSEYGATPQAVLTFNPEPWGSIEKLNTQEELEFHNFLDMPDASALYAEHSKMMDTITELGVTVLELSDLWQDSGANGHAEVASTSPNLFFTRDSSLTLPFEGAESLVVSAKMGLPSRQKEPELVTQSLLSMGYDVHVIGLNEDDTIEGGDIIPVTLDGKKTLLVGISSRTTYGAAEAIADELGEHVDQVIAIHHPSEVLHLDTGLSFYAGVMVVAEGMFEQAAILKPGKASEEVDAYKYLRDNGFESITVSQAAAVHQEICNVLPLGNNHFLGFEEMGSELISKIEALSGATVHTTPGGEIALASGGVHCSTRPIYLKNQNAVEQSQQAEAIVLGNV
jgi:N-dimethylarginine dimethylaminohydrolase